MPLSYRIVIKVMCRSDLDSPCAKLGINVFIGNDWDFSAHQGQDNLLSNEITIAFILWVYHQSDVAQHGFWKGGRNDEGSHFTARGVLLLSECSLYLIMLLD